MKQLLKLSTFCALLALIAITEHKPESKELCHLMDNVEEKIPVESDTGIDEATFNRVLDKFASVYNSIVKKEGYSLVIVRKWKDETINASTTVRGKDWIINAYGGLARYPSMNAETYMMVMCHEMGHHLAGFPAQGWASNEGQSDYYATMKCYRRLVESGYDDGLYNADVPKLVEEACSKQHKSLDDITVCKKGASIGYTLANILNSLSGSSNTVNFDTPDKSKVSKTNNAHPKAQCRLDTYYAGAVCGIHYTEEFSSSDPVVGACAEEKKDTFGVRPNCWYKPQ
jgi:hypothetical protein